MRSEKPSTPDKMKQVLQWVDEELKDHPGKTKREVFEEAEFKFDLSPQECEFLNRHFAGA